MSDIDEDEVRYLSTTSVKNNFGGESLCERADIYRRNKYDKNTIPLKNFNEGFTQMMVNKEMDNKNEYSEYEIESIVQSVMDQKDYASTSSSATASDDDSIEELIVESEKADNWTPNVLVKPTEEEFVECHDFHSIMDFDDSLHSCLAYKSIESQPYESAHKAFAFHKSFLDRIKQIKCRDITLQLYLWPSIMKNISITCISGPKTGKTNAYLVPLMNWFDSREAKDNKSDAIVGAIVICSSTRQTYYIRDEIKRWRDYKVAKMEQTLRVVSLNTSNEKSMVTAILNGCDILISTPGPLLRAIESSIMDTTNTRCLIIDEADTTLALHLTTVREIYLNYARMKKNIKRFVQKNGTVSNPMAFQTMVFAQKLTEDVKWFSREIQHMPSVFFGSFCEASIALRVDSRVVVIDNEKYREKEVQNLAKNVIQTLENPKSMKSKYKRIAIVCRTEDEIRFLRLHLKEEISSTLVLEVTENTVHFNLEHRRQNWNNHSGVVLMFITDSAIKQVEGFQTAVCIIQYKLPNNFDPDFGRRFYLFRKQFHRVKNPITAHTFPTLTNIVVVSPIDSHIPELVAYMHRVGYAPEKLLKLCNYALRPLCLNFVSFGKCPIGSPYCSDRHMFNASERPLPELPSNGQIEIVISHVLGANQFYFRLQRYRNESHTSGQWQKRDITYDDISPHLNALKDSDYNTVKCVDTEEVYGLSVRGQVLRVLMVRILSEEELRMYEEYDINDKTEKIEVFCIDCGMKIRTHLRQLFRLPEELRDLPPFAYKGYLFGIKPLDNEIEWDFKSTQKFTILVDNYRVTKITAWVLKQVNGFFWLNRMSVGKRLKNAKIKVEMNPIHYLIEKQLVEQNDNTLPNVNTDYHQIVNIWHNHRLNSAAFNSYLTDDSSYVVLIDFVSITRFYVMFEDRVKRLEQLEDKWLTFLPSLEALTEVTENQICFYRGTDNNEEFLNRAKVVAISDNTAELFLVDHGETVKTDKSNLFRMAESFLKELPFQAIEVKLFGVEEIESITYDNICELTRNEDDQYLMTIAEKISYENGVHTIRLFVAQNKSETHFVSLSKLLVDKNYAKYVDGEEDNEMEFDIIKEVNDPNELDVYEELEDYMKDNMVKHVLQEFGFNEEELRQESIDASEKSVVESRAAKTRRRLRAIAAKLKAENNESSDESDEDAPKPVRNKIMQNSGDYDYPRNLNILPFDPDDHFDDNCDHTDEEGVLEEEEMS